MMLVSARAVAPEVLTALRIGGILPMEQGGVEEHPTRTERLSTPLRPEPDQDDVSIVVADVQRRRVSVDVLLT